MSQGERLLFKRQRRSTSGVQNRVTAADAGWKDLGVELRALAPGEAWSDDTGPNEAVLVLFGGTAAIRSSRGEWERVGRRAHVFDGMPWALYLPRGTRFTVEAAHDQPVEIAWAWAPAHRDRDPVLVRPADVAINVRGGHSNTRQINAIVPPGFPCDRLVCVEVFTPSGNWSSYPPHKHDAHTTDASGGLVEADLEEIYLYKMNRPGGHALQRLYTDDRSLDVTVTAEDGDVVLVPHGYHPVSAPYGYDCYYLNFLAGSAQSLASTDDPAHAWVKSTWTATDPRVPMVTMAMEERAR